MNKNVAILFRDYGPYHVARIQALNKKLTNEGYHLFALRIYPSSDQYGWNPCSVSSPRSLTLLSKQSLLSPFWAFIRLFSIILRHNIDAIFLPSYSPLVNLSCALAALLTRTRLILMIDTWEKSSRDSFFIKLLKRLIIPRFNSALVAGSKHVDYISSFGIPRSKIFKGYDVVDNNHFMSRKSDNFLSRYKNFSCFPKRYVLSVGRFVDKKNLGFVLYGFSKFLARYRQHHNSTSLDAPSLVFVGEGPEFSSLVQLAYKLNLNHQVVSSSVLSLNKSDVYFFPFQQYDSLPSFYSLAQCSVIASSYEEWGLVVNESMAASTPVIVADTVGCSSDLIKHSENGFLFKSGNLEEFVDSLFTVFQLDQSSMLHMRNQAFKTISAWDLEFFANSAHLALVSSYL